MKIECTIKFKVILDTPHFTLDEAETEVQQYVSEMSLPDEYKEDSLELVNYKLIK